MLNPMYYTMNLAVSVSFNVLFTGCFGADENKGYYYVLDSVTCHLDTSTVQLRVSGYKNY